MKKIIILDCGPSLKKVSNIFGQSPEWIIDILKDKDCVFSWIKSYLGEKLHCNEGDAWIITGSPQSVYDEESWMLDLEDNIRLANQNKIPVLGICFGHQLIAKSFGGKVEKNPQGWELGAYPILLTKDGEKSFLFKNIKKEIIVYESHQDAVTCLPKEAIELAHNKKCTQAFKLFDTLYSIQFHPEFSLDIMKKYVSIRGSFGVSADDPTIPESMYGYLVLHNFINLI